MFPIGCIDAEARMPADSVAAASGAPEDLDSPSGALSD
jgi:hypothetical protein